MALIGLAIVGCAGPPMAVTVGHSPVAYTQPQAVAPLAPGITATAPLPPFVALVTAPVVGVRPAPASGGGSGTGGPGGVGPAARAGRPDDPVVTVPGYVLPAYGTPGSHPGG
jgi:hypothetical protein